MSRYSVPAQDPVLTVIVGWTTPGHPFFAQAFNPAIEDEAEADLLWIGTAFQEIPTVAALQAQLTGWAIHPARHRGLPHVRSTGRHAAYPAAALGTAVPARHGDTPLRSRLTQRRRLARTLLSGHSHHPSTPGGLDHANHPRHDRLPESRPAVLRHLCAP